jgi:adenylate cyclase
MTERRLSAIAVADVVGYSAMMAKDEDGTLAALNAHLNAIDPVIRNHGGRTVKSTGDGFIVEFASATGAVRAALEVQGLLAERNATLPEGRAMQMRIGINVGDVVIGDDGDVFGDGVIVAARIEPLSPPGGIAMSDGVARAVAGKVDVELADTGEHELKNLPRPVRVWSVGDRSPDEAKAAARAYAATVAVLPFDNMSGDPEQDYFGDGLAEDLLTALAHDRNLGVVARNLSFAFRGGDVDVRAVGRELDATHLVEGSVRRFGSRVRISVQLIEVESGMHVWAERFDRELEDVFAIQDEVVEAIATRLGSSFFHGGFRSTRPQSVDAWDLTIEGMAMAGKGTTPSLLAAIEKYEEAHRRDPTLVRPVAEAAAVWATLFFGGWREGPAHPWDKTVEAGEMAYAIDPHDAGALTAMSWIRVQVGDLDEALGFADRAIAVNPFFSFGHHFRGLALSAMARHEEAIPSYTDAWRLGRHHPLRWDTANDLAWTHFFLGNPEASVEWGKQSIRMSDYLQAHLATAASLAVLGRIDEARTHVESALAKRPNLRRGRVIERMTYRDPKDREAIDEAWRLAGLPD